MIGVCGEGEYAFITINQWQMGIASVLVPGMSWHVIIQMQNAVYDD